MSSMNWDRLRIFYVVAQEGSLSRASHILHMTQSALSRQIAQLEQELNQTLFLRVSRGLVLTEAGKTLLPAAEAIYIHVQNIVRSLDQSSDDMSGLLTLVVPTTFLEFWLMPHLNEFLEQYPNMKISIVSGEELNYRHIPRSEVYLQITSYFEEDVNNLECYQLCQYPLYLYGSKNYLEEEGVPHTLEDLSTHRLIRNRDIRLIKNIDIWATAFEKNKKRFAHNLQKNEGDLEFFMLVEGEHAAFQAAKNNLGLAALPAYIAEKSPDLIRVPIKNSPIEDLLVNKFIVYPKRFKSFHRVQAMERFLLETAQKDLNFLPMK